MIMTDAVIRRATGIRLPEGKQKVTQSGSVIVLMHGGVFSF